MDIKTLFNANPNKFKSLAKGKSFEEFTNFLLLQPNFQIMNFMSNEDKMELYKMAKESN